MWETIITGLDNDKQQLAKVLDTCNLVVFRDNYSDFFFKFVIWEGFDGYTSSRNEDGWNKKT